MRLAVPNPSGLRAIAMAVAILCAAAPAWAQDFETSVPYAFLIDAGTDTILLDKNADELMPPASMAKLMTMAVVFNELKAGRLSLDDEFTISENAWRNGGANSGGSTMFAKLNSRCAGGRPHPMVSSFNPATTLASRSRKAYRRQRRRALRA